MIVNHLERLKKSMKMKIVVCLSAISVFIVYDLFLKAHTRANAPLVAVYCVML